MKDARENTTVQCSLTGPCYSYVPWDSAQLFEVFFTKLHQLREKENKGRFVLISLQLLNICYCIISLSPKEILLRLVPCLTLWVVSSEGQCLAKHCDKNAVIKIHLEKVG